jgi:hypothetical protein
MTKAIPITEKWLNDFGFKKEVLSDNSAHYYILELNETKYCDLAIISSDKNGFIEVALFPYEEWFRYKYVHELQNLYFAITGRELELKTNSCLMEPYGGECNILGCEREAENGGGCWRESGYWRVCSKHSKDYREGKPQPEMKPWAIAREKRRGTDGVLTPVIQTGREMRNASSAGKPISLEDEQALG